MSELILPNHSKCLPWDPQMTKNVNFHTLQKNASLVKCLFSKGHQGLQPPFLFLCYAYLFM